MAEAAHSKPPPSLFSWPPNPTLITVHILIRSILLVVNPVGIALNFILGIDRYFDSAIAAGSFQVAGLVIVPGFIFWNCRQLSPNRNRKSKFFGGIRRYQQLENNDETPKLPGTKMLKMALIFDCTAFVAFLVLYILCTGHESNYGWGGYPVHLIEGYASVGLLVCFVVHFVLAVTQAAQLHSASEHHRLASRCPVCNNPMKDRVGRSMRSDPRQQLLESEESLVDTYTDATINAQQDERVAERAAATTPAAIMRDVASDQETTILQSGSPRAPAKSRRQDRPGSGGYEYSDANTAEGENDTLISKSG